ncbi:MAG: polyphosphate:AMP phosphotransferase [Betaproteobacteria bacterium]|nr:polyphosphate:AMP phosphotransferase [Betaproteobacteria bacterium]
MFDAAEIGHRIGRKAYRAREPELRRALLDAQYRVLEEGRFPVVVLVNGVDGAGKGETVNLLNEWMDPRHVRTEAFGEAAEEDGDRPEMWRFWQVLPPKGHVGILFGSWYTDPILKRVMRHEKRSRFLRRLERIRHFERMLVAEGALILKFWFHLSRRAQRDRLRKLSADPDTRWRVGDDDWRHHEHYDEFVKVCEAALRETSTGEAPWHIVDGSDPAYRALTVGQVLLDAMLARLDGPAPSIAPSAPPPAPALDGRDLLGTLDHSHTLRRDRYAARLEHGQAHLNRLTRDRRFHERSMIVVFEGMDAAGKGSTIRRVTQAMDARFYRVVPIAAPTDEERAQPYLWRFWRHLPRRGHSVIFDRSWYGRVLVERVEGLCGEADWIRAYHEINEFEEQLAESGAILVKFWLAITPEEQLRRFHERESVPHKQFKITSEDWRNREKWPRYERAVADMVERTSTDIARWHLVSTENKLAGRVAVIERICEAVEAAL